MLYKGVDKSLARPEMKQANVSVRMAWISLYELQKNKQLMTSNQFAAYKIN